MNSRSGGGFIGWRRVKKQLSCILAGCVVLGLTFVNCVSIEAGCCGSRIQSVIKASDAGQAMKDAIDLETGKPIERELKSGEIHTYQVSLRVNQFLKVVVDQRGIDVAVSLFGPDGKKIAEANISFLTQVQESISVISDAAGSYRLEVRSLDNSVHAGRYEIKIEEIRSATQQDSVRVAAEREIAQAEQLRSQGTAETFRRAIDKYEEVLPLGRSTSDLRLEALTLNNIGEVYYLLGERQKALEYHNQALPIRRSVGDRPGEATTLNNIGEVYSSLGERQKALEYYNQALPIHRSVGNRSGEAATLNGIGMVYNSLGERQKALDYYNQALPIRRSVGDRSGEAKTLSNIGSVYSSLGEKQKALDYYNQALAIQRSVGNRSGEATTLNNIGLVYSSLGERQKALEYYNQALPIQRSVGNRPGEATTLSNIGGVYSSLGEMQKALDYYNQSLPIRRSVGDKPGEAMTFNSIGVVFTLLGEMQKALEYHNQALPIRRSVGDKSGEATTLNNIGGVYSSLGEMQKALEYYNQALAIRRSIGDRQRESSTLTAIGVVYDSLGEKQKALEYYNQALPIQRSVGDRPGEARALYNIGIAYNSLGEKQKALDCYNQALSIFRSTKDRLGEATTLNGIGSVYSSLGERQKALEYYDQALPIHRSVGDRPGEARTLNNIGEVYYSLGETQKAHDNHTQSLLLSRAVLDLYAEAKSLYGIARVKLKQGELLQARSNLESALHIVESLRVKVASPELRASFFASVQDYYDFYINLLMRMHQLDPNQGIDAVALEVSERARARTLMEMLAEARADIRQGVDLALLERERSLQQLLDAKAERQTRMLSGKHTEQQAAEMKAEIERLLIQYQEVQSQVRASSPRYAALTQPQPLSLRQIQQEVLDSDTLLLEYALGDEHSYLWAVSSDSIASFRLPGREAVEKAARHVYELLTTRNRREQGMSSARLQARIKQAEAEYNRAAAELSQMILGPVAARLGKKRLLVVADGILNYLPFAALPAPTTARSSSDKRDGAGVNKSVAQDGQHLLLAEHEIISLPSASSLAVLRKELSGTQACSKSSSRTGRPCL